MGESVKRLIGIWYNTTYINQTPCDLACSYRGLGGNNRKYTLGVGKGTAQELGGLIILLSQ